MLTLAALPGRVRNPRSAHAPASCQTSPAAWDVFHLCLLVSTRRMFCIVACALARTAVSLQSWLQICWSVLATCCMRCLCGRSHGTFIVDVVAGARELCVSMAASVFSTRRAFLCCLYVPLHGGVIASLADVACQCSPRVSRAVSECGLHQSGCHGVCEYVLPCSSLRRFGSEAACASQRVRRRCDADPQLVSAVVCLGQRVLLALLSVHALR